MNDGTQPLEVAGWTLRVRQPAGPGPHPVICLNHGWTGDEDVMWVFASRLPENSLLIAPQAPYPSTLGGYSWVERKSGEWPTLTDFQPAMDAFMMLLEALPDALEGDFTRISLVGFSQGGAFSYGFALRHPDRVDKLAGLAGFLPEGAHAAIADRPFEGMPVFVGHGTRDELVPVEMAQRAVEQLRRAGGQVRYCETDVGHKLGAECFRALEAFFA